MNWVQENKFLTGLLAVTVLGAGFLGYQVVTASGAASDADQRFTTKATEYNRLRRLVPFPNREHLAAFEAQKAEATEAITAFQSDLAKREFPIEPTTPEQFQDKLKVAVTAMRGKMQDAGIKFPEKFYLGFERYETVPPAQDAAPLLGRQLKAIEWTVDQFVAAHVSELKELKRTELPEEKARAGAAVAKPAADAERAKSQLVTPYPFDLIVAGRQDRVAAALNQIIATDAPQFFIPRSVKFKNLGEKAPPRISETPVAVNPQDPNAPVVPAKAIDYIVGREEVEMAIRLEMIDFANVAPKKP